MRGTRQPPTVAVVPTARQKKTGGSRGVKKIQRNGTRGGGQGAIKAAALMGELARNAENRIAPAFFLRSIVFRSARESGVIYGA